MYIYIYTHHGGTKETAKERDSCAGSWVTHSGESARGGAGGDDVQFFRFQRENESPPTTHSTLKKKFYEPLTLHSTSAPFFLAAAAAAAVGMALLELYTYTLGSLRRVGWKKRVSLSLSFLSRFYEWLLEKALEEEVGDGSFILLSYIAFFLLYTIVPYIYIYICTRNI